MGARAALEALSPARQRQPVMAGYVLSSYPCWVSTLMYLVYTIIPTNAVCCPDINIEDVVLSNMIGEIAENIAYTQCFLV